MGRAVALTIVTAKLINILQLLMLLCGNVWRGKIELGASLFVQLSTMHELILHKESSWKCVWVRKCVYTVRNAELNISQKHKCRKWEGCGKWAAHCGEKTTLLVITKGWSWEGRAGDISWVAAAGGGGGEAAVLYLGENECHSVSFRCQASCWEPCASLKGDSKETEPHCCCHGHSAAQFSAVGNRLVQLAAGCWTWAANHVIFTMRVKAIVSQLLVNGLFYRTPQGWGLELIS